MARNLELLLTLAVLGSCSRGNQGTIASLSKKNVANLPKPSVSYELISAYQWDVGQDLQVQVSMLDEVNEEVEGCTPVYDVHLNVVDERLPNHVIRDWKEEGEDRWLISQHCLEDATFDHPVSGKVFSRFGERKGVYSLDAGTEAVLKEIHAYVFAAGDFIDARGLSPTKELEPKAYRGKEDYGMWTINRLHILRTSEDEFSYTMMFSETQRKKGAAGIDLQEYGTHVTGVFRIYDQRTGQILALKEFEEEKEVDEPEPIGDSLITFGGKLPQGATRVEWGGPESFNNIGLLEDLPAIVRHYDLSGPFYVDKEIVDNAGGIPESYKGVFSVSEMGEGRYQMFVLELQ